MMEDLGILGRQEPWRSSFSLSTNIFDIYYVADIVFDVGGKGINTIDTAVSE